MTININSKGKKDDTKKSNCQGDKSLKVPSTKRDRLPEYIQIVVAAAAIATFWVVTCQMVEQTRAWVTIKKAYHDPFKVGEKAKVHIVLTNSGNSPALEVSAQTELELRDSEPPTPLPFRESSKARSKSVIGPDVFPRISISSQLPLTKQAIDIISNQNKRLYVWGRIEYIDIFKRHRVTDFCMRNEFGTKDFEACENNNTAK